MKVLLSPAKKLDFSKTPDLKDVNNIVFPQKTAQLQNELKKYSSQEIGNAMKLSPQLSELNYQRFQMMGSSLNEKGCAGFVFNGEVYSGLDITSLTKDDLIEAEEKLRILSGLYGILTPCTLIEPYRLEMGTKLAIGGHKNLYQFWEEDILNFIQREESEVIVNLASTEYSKAARLKQFSGKVITPVFKEFKKGDYKVVMVYAKQARGMMAHWIIKERIQNYQDLKNFNQAGYLFNEELSSEHEWVFTR